MKTEPNQEQIDKLPVWAKTHLIDLQRQRDAAVTTLNKMLDEQTPSPVFYEDHPCTGEAAGPSYKKRYVQTDRVVFRHAGVELNVYLAREKDSQRDYGIELSWQREKDRIGHVALIPKSFQQFQLVAKEYMR